MHVRVDGTCDRRFRPVREAFESNFVDLDEVGAALCVHAGPRVVVDIWGGHADAARTRPWLRDTLVNAYSVGKGILAILALGAVERGEIELDAPVARWWPEFAAEGKADLTVRGLLAHRGGLPAVRKRLPERAMLDWPRMCTALGEQRPFWEPGTAHGYHVNTYGFLVGELLRRATGHPVGELLARRIADPCGAEFFFGLPRTQHDRVAETLAPDVALTTEEEWAAVFPPTGDRERDLMIWHTYFNPSGFSGMGAVNTAAWREAVIPSTNGHGTARGVAAVYAAFLAGGPSGQHWPGAVLRSEAVETHSDGEDCVLGRDSRFGLGFQLAQPGRRPGGSDAAFGHYGYGGTLGFADPGCGLAFGYLMNRPGERWNTRRTQRLIDVLYACL